MHSSIFADMPVACCGVILLPNVQPSRCTETIAKTVNVTGCEGKIHDFMHENTKTMEITLLLSSYCYSCE